MSSEFLFYSVGSPAGCVSFGEGILATLQNRMKQMEALMSSPQTATTTTPTVNKNVDSDHAGGNPTPRESRRAPTTDASSTSDNKGEGKRETSVPDERPVIPKLTLPGVIGKNPEKKTGPRGWGCLTEADGGPRPPRRSLNQVFRGTPRSSCTPTTV